MPLFLVKFCAISPHEMHNNALQISLMHIIMIIIIIIIIITRI